ncbi:Thiol:disulfide interchange protein DsbA [Candidatus Kinetoplastibacterium sorsogonicusi]|uniref:Thiol:disulfide interchange protein n=1 Tax=Candidatus Kinetoplastidibacterium kentomonadis TaxID=1576550 RepID=A0A3S7J912_9PROT|nr:hypothetical protein [Candidatus Kinetoplastibacterium sorsogonicusi]AWD32153.1 Thiol:disulfide interchange protein DsbA [Candidatus Kinetoplastibacterium sorsogonicusi]
MNIKRLFYILICFSFAQFAYSQKLIDHNNKNYQKIEVLEFFSYNCKSCFSIFNNTNQFNLSKNQDLFLKIPISFNIGMKNLQHLFFTINLLGREDLHKEIFKAIHKDGIKLYNKKDIDEWIIKHQINIKNFNQIFYSYDVTSKVQASNLLAKIYKINYLPVFIINRKLITLPKYENVISDILLNMLFYNKF